MLQGIIESHVECTEKLSDEKKKWIEDMKAEQVEHNFRINIFSQFFIASHLVKRMKEGCNIINSLSRQAYLGMLTTFDYASSKVAILTFTRGLSRQLAKRGRRINGVYPHINMDPY